MSAVNSRAVFCIILNDSLWTVAQAQCSSRWTHQDIHFLTRTIPETAVRTRYASRALFYRRNNFIFCFNRCFSPVTVTSNYYGRPRFSFSIYRNRRRDRHTHVRTCTVTTMKYIIKKKNRFYISYLFTSYNKETSKWHRRDLPDGQITKTRV